MGGDPDRGDAGYRERALGGGGNDFATRRAPTEQWVPGCQCSEGPPVPAVVLDPFGGTGTTAAAALRLGRHAVVCDLWDDYIRNHAAERVGELVLL